MDAFEPAGPAGVDAPPPERDTYVCVYASQVAACIGANRHKKVNEAFEQVWERVDPQSYHAALARAGQRTEDQSLLEIMAGNESVKTLVDRSMQTRCDSSQAVAGEYGDAGERLTGVADLTPEQRTLVDGEIRKNLYTSFGNRHESDALAYVRSAYGIDAHPDDTFFKKRVGAVVVKGREVPWFVGGKVDAIDAAGDVIEIKNRVNRLFYRAPWYEEVQVQTYLNLVGAPRGYLIEAYRPDSTAPPDVNIIRLLRDASWGELIVPRLAAFVDYLGLVLSDEKLQDRYLASKRRTYLITRHRLPGDPEDSPPQAPDSAA
jgi:hypothetical protein